MPAARVPANSAAGSCGGWNVAARRSSEKSKKSSRIDTGAPGTACSLDRIPRRLHLDLDVGSGPRYGVPINILTPPPYACVQNDTTPSRTAPQGKVGCGFIWYPCISSFMTLMFCPFWKARPPAYPIMRLAVCTPSPPSTSEYSATCSSGPANVCIKRREGSGPGSTCCALIAAIHGGTSFPPSSPCTATTKNTASCTGVSAVASSETSSSCFEGAR